MQPLSDSATIRLSQYQTQPVSNSASIRLSHYQSCSLHICFSLTWYESKQEHPVLNLLLVINQEVQDELRSTDILLSSSVFGLPRKMTKLLSWLHTCWLGPMQATVMYNYVAIASCFSTQNDNYTSTSSSKYCECSIDPLSKVLSPWKFVSLSCMSPGTWLCSSYLVS